MKKNKILFYFIPFLLFLLGTLLSLAFGGISFSTVSYVHSENIIKQNPQRIFVKGDKLTGEFSAKEPFLGIFQIRFDKYSGINYTGNDRLFFRLKESGAKTWYYENYYSINEFEKSFIVPFGFPVINNSSGKNYYFEVESLDGNGKNSVQISRREPVFQSVYQFPKNMILSLHFFPHFLYTKIFFSLTNLDFLLSSVLYFIPLFFYLVWLMSRNRINIIKRFFAYLVVVLIFFDSFIIPGNHLGILFFLLGMWIFVVILYKLESTVTYLISMSFFLVVFILVSFNIMPGQEKLQTYVYFLFVFGLIQSIYEIKFKSKKFVNYKKFIKEMLNLHEK